MKLWILSSSLLILIVIGLRSLLKGRISFRVQYAIWLIVLLRLLVPFPVGRSLVSVENILPTSVPAAMRLQSRAEPAAQISGTEFPAAPSAQKEGQPTSAASPVSRSFLGMDEAGSPCPPLVQPSGMGSSNSLQTGC